MNNLATIIAQQAGASSHNSSKGMRNTYLQIAMTLLVSALTAGLSMALALPQPGLLITFSCYSGLLLMAMKFRDSIWRLPLVFTLSGLLGYTLGPLLNTYLGMSSGSQVVMIATGTTAIIFLALFGYTLISRSDFGVKGSFLMVSILVGFPAGLGAIFFEMPGLSMTVSTIFVVFMAGLIIHEISNISHEGKAK